MDIQQQQQQRIVPEYCQSCTTAYASRYNLGFTEWLSEDFESEHPWLRGENQSEGFLPKTRENFHSFN
jgi:hypothetical protein